MNTRPMNPESSNPFQGLSMRIISGRLKGRRLLTPTKGSLRPTSDRVKESMFNILGKEVEGRVVLDLFAGTGNLGIETLSRGGEENHFCRKSREAFRLIERNLSLCEMEDRSEILLKDVIQALCSLKQKRESLRPHSDGSSL